MHYISPDLVLVASGEEEQKQVSRQLAVFLSQLASRIETLPVTIAISLETNDDIYWHFAADIESVKDGLHADEAVSLSLPSPPG